MSEVPLGVNTRQHGPAGEHEPGFHPSQYWDPLAHTQSGKALYGRYVRPGDLVFDVGANVGQRTGWFLEMGCKVVAVEPLKAMLDFCDGNAVRINAAVSDKVAESVPFWVCDSSQYLSTLSEAYVAQVYEQPGIGGNIYHQTTVPTVTLDSLIARYGVPAFVKIDVEGGEDRVLAGLSQPLKALSFEVHAFDPAKASVCIAMLERLGRYHYEYAPLETFQIGPWPPAEQAIFGDVYAVLQQASEVASGAASGDLPRGGRHGASTGIQSENPAVG